MRRCFVFALLTLWMLTTASSCQTTAQNGRFTAQGEDFGAIAVVLVVAGLSCLANERCLDPAPRPRDQLEATFEAGVHRFKAGDQSGLDWICLSAHQGSARAQYFYGVHLFRRDQTVSAQSRAWFARAAAQDHKAAKFLLLETGGWTGLDTLSGPLQAPLAVAPPALRACVDRRRIRSDQQFIEALKPEADQLG